MCLLRYFLCILFFGVINFWDVIWFVGNNWCGLFYLSIWNLIKIFIRSFWKEVVVNIRWWWWFGNGIMWYLSCRNGGKFLFFYMLWCIFWMFKIILMNYKCYWVILVGFFSFNFLVLLFCCIWLYVLFFCNFFIIIWVFLMILGE